MWYGTDTKELLRLKQQYLNVTGFDPDGEMTLEYGDDEYDEYVRDLKTCIKKGISLGDLYPDDEDDW